MATEKDDAVVRVWDPIVRIGHWVIVVGFFTAYLTGDEFLSVHVWAGYAVSATVAVRIVWGFVGPRHARFASFVRGPAATWRHISGLISGRAERHLGHNPAGAAMILALLVALSGTIVSGLALYAVEEGKGPFAVVMAAASSDSELSRGLAMYHSDSHEREEDGEYDRDHGEHEFEEAEELLEEAHSAFTYVTLILIGLHILGVVASSLAHRENLVRAMVTGVKRAGK